MYLLHKRLIEETGAAGIFQSGFVRQEKKVSSVVFCSVSTRNDLNYWNEILLYSGPFLLLEKEMRGIAFISVLHQGIRYSSALDLHLARKAPHNKNKKGEYIFMSGAIMKSDDSWNVINLYYHLFLAFIQGAWRLRGNIAKPLHF